MFTLGVSAGVDRRRTAAAISDSLPPIAGILLIVGAGGGFKQTLVDAGVGGAIIQAAQGAHIPALVLGWLVAVGIRLATGSETVATISSAGIVGPLAAGLDPTHTALLVLAIGSGRCSTLESWSVMETIISLVSMACVLLVDLLL
jgi:GntP family gluconate:H+ symporter